MKPLTEKDLDKPAAEKALSETALETIATRTLNYYEENAA